MHNKERDKFFFECLDDIHSEPILQKEIEFYEEIMG
jgi:hypothetical protein